MPTATVTSKGQITIPKEVREFLNLKTGEKVDFVLGENRKVILYAINRDVRELRGFFKSPFKRPVTIEEMNESIAEGAGHYRR